MSVLNVIFYQEAEVDIAGIVHYIAEDNLKAAKEFLVAIDDLCELLMHTPDIGSMRIFQNPKLRGLRVFPLKKFQKYLVFYRVCETTVEIVRVIHGARDCPSFFE